MIIQLKAAPELGRLRVVKDDGNWSGCDHCALAIGGCIKLLKEIDYDCFKNEIYFEQVKPNDN